MLKFIKQAFKDYWDIQDLLAEQGIHEIILPCYPYLLCFIDPERLEQYYDKQRTISKSRRPTED